MSKEIDVFKRSIGELLGRYERRPVVLPEFQRPYSWDKAQVLAFWDDLLTFKDAYTESPVTAGYFLGSVVVLRSDKQIVLLDGQQRLATATIALSAMRDIARTLDTSGTTLGHDFARDIQRELLEKDTDPVTYSMTLSELDDDFFTKAIKKDPTLAVAPKIKSHQLIEAARDLIRSKIRDLVDGLKLQDAIKLLKALQDALTKGMVVVVITVQSEDEAYNIFETLNDRGLRLSVPDLVLNLLMRRAEDKAKQKAIRDKWNSIVRQLGQRDVSRFLRHMWVSRHGDVKAQGLFTVIKNSLTKNQVTSVDFADECAEECETYVGILDLTIKMAKDARFNMEGLVKYLNVQPALPLLLSGYRSLSESDFAKLVRLATAHYVRHTLVLNQNPLELESAFYSAARAMRTSKDKGDTSAKVLQAARQELAKLEVDDISVIAAVSTLELERPQAIWILTQLANHLQSGTKEVAMSQANLEHIFPQNANSGWAGRDKLEPFIWHIGNLTVLGEKLNRQAQNKPFLHKRDNFYCKSEIKMTRDLLAVQDWNEKEIAKRAKNLARNVIQVWRTS